MVVDYPIREVIIYKGLNCYDSCVATYVHNSILSHEFLYSRFWNETDFQYDPENHSYNSKFFFENLYSYFRTKIMIYANFTEQSIYELINTYHIFMVQVDLFYYPYSASFQIRHAPHFFLVHGYDTDGKSIYISDPSQKFQGKKMNMSVFMNIQRKVFVFCLEGSLESNSIFTINREMELEISCDELARNLENIECRLVKIIDQRKTILEDSLAKGALFFNRLASNRFCYLRYLEAYYRNRQMVFNHSEKFFEIGKKYEAIKNMLYKCMSMEKQEHICENIIKRYNDVIVEEQDMASFLNDELIRLVVD